MPTPVTLALADDLTGAAEIAGAAFARGLSAGVRPFLDGANSMNSDTGDTPSSDVVVLDTDSRLLTAEIAAARVAATWRACPFAARSPCFKKTDSVLRGSVAAELFASASTLGLPRALLVPANPALGRTIDAGRYAIDGTPLHATSFARDPHHPATTDDVLALLGASDGWPHVSLRRGTTLPARGLAVADATHAADLSAWAEAVDRTTLPAGSAAFFAAWLEHHVAPRCIPRDPAPPPPEATHGPTLILVGSLSPVARHHLTSAAAHGLPVIELPAVASTAITTTADAAQRAFAHASVVTIAAALSAGSPEDPQLVRDGFASLTEELHARRVFRHLVIEGGATAAAVLRRVRWSQLEVVAVWSPGVIALRPAEAPSVLLTLKPGSYPWPTALDTLISPAAPSHRRPPSRLRLSATAP